MAEGLRGFGVAGEYPLATILAAASRAEAAGYATFWLSQPPDRDSLVTLARVYKVTEALSLGIGAIPLTARPAEEIANGVRKERLPTRRLRLGVGSGIGPGALIRLREGVSALRALLDVEIVIAPLGPRMCQLAGEIGDSVLLNWLTPAYARQSAAWVREGAALAGREPPLLRAYVRCALGSGARARLEREGARYAAFPHYAAHFSRQGVLPIQTALATADVRDLQEGLDAFASILDEVIARAITADDSVTETLELLDATAPGR